METEFSIHYLVDFPEQVQTATDWVLADRKHFYPSETLVDARKRVVSCLSKGEIPFSLVAMKGQEAAGYVCVMTNNAPPGYDQLTPWLASLVVAPGCRGMGLEADLLNRAVLEARGTGCVELFTWTDSDKDWYQQMGWKVAGTTIFGRRYVGVLRLELAK